jgi:hypothetical protein
LKIEEIRNDSNDKIAFYEKNDRIQKSLLTQQADEFDQQYDDIQDKVLHLSKSFSNLEKENIKLKSEKDLIEGSFLNTSYLVKDKRQVCPNKERCNGYGNQNSKFNNHRSLNFCPLALAVSIEVSNFFKINFVWSLTSFFDYY